MTVSKYILLSICFIVILSGCRTLESKTVESKNTLEESVDSRHAFYIMLEYMQRIVESSSDSLPTAIFAVANLEVKDYHKSSAGKVRLVSIRYDNNNFCITKFSPISIDSLNPSYIGDVSPIFNKATVKGIKKIFQQEMAPAFYVANKKISDLYWLGAIFYDDKLWYLNGGYIDLSPDEPLSPELFKDSIDHEKVPSEDSLRRVFEDKTYTPRSDYSYPFEKNCYFLEHSTQYGYIFDSSDIPDDPIDYSSIASIESNSPEFVFVDEIYTPRSDYSYPFEKNCYFLEHSTMFGKLYNKDHYLMDFVRVFNKTGYEVFKICFPDE